MPLKKSNSLFTLIIPLVFLIVGFGCKNQKNSQAGPAFIKPAVGCGNFQVFLLSEDNSSYLLVGLNARQTRLSRVNSFDLETDDNITVLIRSFLEDVSAQLCNDIRSASPPEIQEEDEAVSGRLTVKLSDEDLELYGKGVSYRVTLILENILFKNQKEPLSMTIEDVVVGWLPG